jgi:lipocalin
LLPDGKIEVINRCRKDRTDGPLKESKGKAEVVDPNTNVKLKVWFFGLSRGIIGSSIWMTRINGWWSVNHENKNDNYSQ